MLADLDRLVSGSPSSATQGRQPAASALRQHSPASFILPEKTQMDRGRTDPGNDSERRPSPRQESSFRPGH
eukprot:7797185-Pyramimonas_sp.AAC.1